MEKKTRIAAIVEIMPKYPVIADIGADHGQTSARLLSQGKAQKTITTDISSESLKKARRLAEQLGLQQKMDFRVGDGLTVLKEGEAQGIIISGMGAMLIIHMLEQQMEVAKSAQLLVLSPNNYEDRLRLFLWENGFRLVEETIAQEGERFYQILCAKAGQETRRFTPLELEFGPLNLQRHSSQLQALVQKRWTKATKILAKLDVEEHPREIARLQKQVAAYENILKQ